jgi:hypothetical protein
MLVFQHAFLVYCREIEAWLSSGYPSFVYHAKLKPTQVVNTYIGLVYLQSK